MEDEDQAAPFVGNIGGMVISIPSIEASPIKPVEQQGSIDCTQSGETAGTTASLADSERELLQQVKATIGKRRSGVVERDARNDSFLNRLSALSESRNNTNNQQVSYEKFYIGNLDDDDDFDVVSRASGMDATAATHRELIEAVERLDVFLKQTELELTNEKKKRRDREINLIKLAKELGTRGKIIESQHEAMRKLKDEVRSARVDIALLKTKLQHETFLNKETKLDSKKDHARSIEEAQVVYDHTVSEHDHRISEIGKTHAKQCEELCKEVIEANQDAARLRRKLKELNTDANADQGLNASQTSKGDLVLKMITVVVIAATAYVALSASGESPVGMCSGSAGAPKLEDMINHQLFVPRPTISEPTVEAATPPTKSLPVDPREIQISEPEEVSIEAKIDGANTLVRDSKPSTETSTRRRGQGIVQMFSLNDRPNLLKGLSMTPDLPENALLTLILKRK